MTPIREGLVVSPADGRISAIERVRPPPELGFGIEERQRISVFLSVFDVHINRAPVAGRIIDGQLRGQLPGQRTADVHQRAPDAAAFPPTVVGGIGAEGQQKGNHEAQHAVQ